MITNTKLSSNFIKLLLTAVFCTTIVSCSELLPSGETFIVRRSESYGEKTKYFIEGETGRSSFYIKTETYYKVGDTLRLVK